MHEFQCISSSLHFHHTFPLIECDLCVGKARDLGVASTSDFLLEVKAMLLSKFQQNIFSRFRIMIVLSFLLIYQLRHDTVYIRTKNRNGLCFLRGLKTVLFSQFFLCLFFFRLSFAEVISLLVAFQSMLMCRFLPTLP